MPFSRQFLALTRLSLWFGGTWAAIGGAIAVVTRSADPDGNLLRWVATHVTMYGTLGALAGIGTGLLLARAEKARRVEDLPTRRMAVWGILGGARRTLAEPHDAPRIGNS